MSVSKPVDDDVQPDSKIDVKGLFSPLPILRIKKELARLSSGKVLQIDTTDTGLYDDIVSWCSRMHHEYLGEKKTPDYTSYYIAKK